MSYLSVANDSDNLAVLLHCIEVILNLSLAILICPSLGSFREGLLLRLAPLCTNRHLHGWWNRRENMGASSHRQRQAERRIGTITWATLVRTAPQNTSMTKKVITGVIWKIFYCQFNIFNWKTVSQWYTDSVSKKSYLNFHKNILASLNG